MLDRLVAPPGVVRFAGILALFALTLASPGESASGPDGAWTLSSDPATAPQRMNHAWIYDPVRDRLLIFGGSRGSPTSGLFALSLSGTPRWTALVPGVGGPVPGDGQQAAYDSARDRMIVFGGYYNCDVWALPLSGPLTWTRLEPTGAPPPARSFASAIDDPVRDRLLIFGGEMYTNQWPYIPISFNDVWALSLGASPAWTPLGTAGPAPHARFEHSATYDPIRDRMIVFGGDTTFYGQGYFGDLWALSLSGTPAWNQLAPGGTAPVARSLARLTYDPARDRLILYGGETADEVQHVTWLLDDLWTLPLNGALEWHALAPSAPPAAREAFAAIYDPPRDRLLIEGGGVNSGSGADDAAFALPLSSGDAWNRVTPGVPPSAPTPRTGATTVYDSKRHLVVIHGGAARAGDVDTWAYSPATLSWTPIVPSGPAPPARSHHSAIYDPVGDRMIIYGGDTNRSDAWSLSFDPAPVWTPLPAGPPAGRGWTAAVYDPVRRRMIISGGLVIGPSDSDTASSEVWALSLSGSPSWSQLPSHPSSEGIFRHSMLYDPIRDRILTIGGSTKRSGTIIVHSLDHRIFALPLGAGGAWSELPSTGNVPQTAFQTLYDPYRDRLLMMGGAIANVNTPSRWIYARPAADAGTWAQLASTGAPPDLQSTPAVFDPGRDQVEVPFTALDPGSTDADQVWALAFSGVLDAPRAPTDAFSLGRPWPDPARGAARVSFTLPDAAPARLEVVDIGGRRVFEREVGGSGAGEHVIDLDSAARWPPGIYLVRLIRGDRARTAKLALMR